MYVQQSQACSVPNSLTPVSPATIAAGQAIVSALNTQAVNAQNVFTALVNRTDLNTNGWPLAEAGGVPAGPTSANPIGGNPTGLKAWPNLKGRTACIVTSPTPAGAPPTALSSYAQAPAPPMPSLVTQGHPSYSPPARGGGGGMGCANGSSCDFLTGMISALGLGAALLYLYDYLQKSGRLQP
jgi:hypothetical protein